MRPSYDLEVCVSEWARKGLIMKKFTVSLLFVAWASISHAQDRIVMKNDDILSGTVAMDTISIITTYGKVSAPIEYIEYYRPEGGGAQIAQLRSINEGIFSGFLADPSIPVSLETGQSLPLRKEKIREIQFEDRPVEYEPTGRARTIMRNGDAFSAELLNEALTITTSYGALDIAQEDIRKVDFEGSDRVVAKVSLRNGDVRQGQLNTEAFSIRLNWGANISVYREKIESIDFGEEIEAGGGDIASTLSPILTGIIGGPVSGTYALVVRKAGAGQVSSSASVSINGESVGVFLNDRVVSVEDSLRKGLNRISIELSPISGVDGDEDLEFKIGPQSGSAFVPEWYFDTSSIAQEDASTTTLYYFVVDSKDKAEVGDVAVFAKPRYSGSPLPIYTDMIVNGEIVARLSGATFGLRLKDLEPNSVQSAQFVTRAYSGVRARNWLSIEIGRVASVDRGRYSYRPILEFSSNTNWSLTDSAAPTTTGPDASTVVINRPFTQ